MRDGDIDYSRYTRQELEEALAGINKQAFPGNYARLQAAWEKQAGDARAHEAAQPEPMAEVEQELPPPPRQTHDAQGRYIPNEVPWQVRLRHAASAVGLLAYGIYGLHSNKLYVGFKHGHGIHLRDAPAVGMFVAFVCGSLILILSVIDHHDRRDNEYVYRLLQRVLLWIGGFFALSSLLIGVLQGA
jgi:hypothetical protein